MQVIFKVCSNNNSLERNMKNTVQYSFYSIDASRQQGSKHASKQRFSPLNNTNINHTDRCQFL